METFFNLYWRWLRNGLAAFFVGLLLVLFAAQSFAQVAISELPAANALTGAEEVPIVQGASTARTTAADIAALAGGGSSGVWSPTCTPSPSIMSACTGIPSGSHYIRVGNQVMFTLWFNATSNANQLGQGNVTIPIASAFAAVTDATGVCTYYSNSNPGAGRIEADITADNLRIFINAGVATNQPWSCTGIYTVI